MDEIIKAVMKQTGLSNEIARQAVTVVLSQLKSQLPRPIADQLEALLGGKAGGAADGTDGLMGTVMKGFGGILDGKQSPTGVLLRIQARQSSPIGRIGESRSTR